MSLDGKKVYGALNSKIEAVEQKLDDAIVGIYSPGGSVAFASLPELTADVLGMVYEVTDDFTTDSRFKEGAGRSYPAGTNVAVINTGTNASPVYKFDATTGAIVVDDALSTTSKNPVQNKVVKGALDGKADLTDIAPAFSEETDYKVGDYVSYDGNIYRFKAAHSAGAWNSAHVDQVTAAGQYVRAGLSTLSGRTMGVKATAEGYNNTPSGQYAHAEGESNFATAEAAHAEGLGNQSTAEAAHSEGESNFARGVASHAEGLWTEATGANGAHSEGYATLASGDASHAGGHATIAQRAYQTVIGEFNEADTGGSHTYDKGDYAFIIGNGTGTNARSNAFGVKWTGDLEAAGDVKDGYGNVLNEMYWEGTSAQWTNLPAATKAKYDGKLVIFTDDAGVYTGLPLPVLFSAVTGSGSTVTRTINNASIVADMKVISSEISNPSAVLSDMSITTANGSVTLSATISGTSDVLVMLQETRAQITG